MSFPFISLKSLILQVKIKMAKVASQNLKICFSTFFSTRSLQRWLRTRSRLSLRRGWFRPRRKRRSLERDDVVKEGTLILKTMKMRTTALMNREKTLRMSWALHQIAGLLTFARASRSICWPNSTLKRRRKEPLMTISKRSLRSPLIWSIGSKSKSSWAVKSSEI